MTIVGLKNASDLTYLPGQGIRCSHCSESKDLEDAPAWRRHGRIVQRVWPNGKRELACHFCGRHMKTGEAITVKETMREIQNMAEGRAKDGFVD